MKHSLVRRENWKALHPVEGMWLLLTSPDGTCASVLASDSASYFYPISHAEKLGNSPQMQKGLTLDPQTLP